MALVHPIAPVQGKKNVSAFGEHLNVGRQRRKPCACPMQGKNRIVARARVNNVSQARIGHVPATNRGAELELNQKP
jgi:hypothetical protein